VTLCNRHGKSSGKVGNSAVVSTFPQLDNHFPNGLGPIFQARKRLTHS